MSLADVLPDAATVAEQLADAPHDDARRRMLRGFVATRADRRAPDRSVAGAARMLEHRPRTDVSTVADDVGMSTRALHRRFRDEVGYGPKTFQRIMRVQRAMTIARQPERIQLADIAVASGYSDQAHMTREFGAITGTTPSLLLTRH